MLPQSEGSSAREFAAKEERLLKAIGEAFPFIVLPDVDDLSFTFMDEDAEAINNLVLPPPSQRIPQEKLQERAELAFGYEHLIHLTPMANARKLIDGLTDLARATLLFLKASVSAEISKPDYPTFIQHMSNGFRQATAREPEPGQKSRPTFLLCLATARELEANLQRAVKPAYESAIPPYTRAFLEKISASQIPDLAQDFLKAVEAGRGRKRHED